MHVVMKAGSLTFDTVQLKTKHNSTFIFPVLGGKKAALRRLAVIDIS